MYKTLVGVAVVLVLAGAAWFGASRYLVSKLDGTGGVTASQEKDPMVEYRSAELGITFAYPEQRYTLSVHASGNAEREWHTVTLVPSTFVPVEGGEGPPSISIAAYSNEGVTLEQWIRGDARSNFKLSIDGALVPLALNGRSGYAYRHSGLYKTDAVAVAVNDRVYVFESGWLALTDQSRTDFLRILDSVKF